MAVALAESTGRWYPNLEVQARASLTDYTVNTPGTSYGPVFEAEDAVVLLSTVTVSAISGTAPNITVRLETTVDDGVSWWLAQTVAFGFNAVDLVGYGAVVGPLGLQCRWRFDLDGTDSPSATFSIVSEARQTSGPP